MSPVLSSVRAIGASGLAASGGEARRLIRGGGARVDGAPVADENAAIGADAIGPDGAIKLSAGKKRHVLVRPAAAA
jgi:tyrosyl-tRNA synthetase